MIENKRVLLIVSGGIAAFKALDIIRLLKKKGVSTPVILTKAAQEFVTPLTCSVLSGEKVYTDLFSLNDELEMGHIELSRDADLIVVVPATADLMAKMAHGICDDLATTTLLATDKDIIFAPAMNIRMWEHAATQRNLISLLADGHKAVGPVEGEMACGEYGYGRMSEPEDIVGAIETYFQKAKPLAGKKILITAGPTHEPIDPVRVIANLSSGKQGYAIAQAAYDAGADVTLISGPVSLNPPLGVKVIKVQTAEQMLQHTQNSLPADIAIFTAAVADWRVENPAEEKVKKTAGKLGFDLNFVENPDILATIAQDITRRPELVIGFAAETEKVIENAIAKRAKKQCDWIIANDVSPETGIMGGDKNKVHIIKAAQQNAWDEMPKTAVAKKLIDEIIHHFKIEARDA